MNNKTLSCLTRKLTVSLCLLAISAASAQTAVEAWVQRYGSQTDGEEAATRVAIDHAGNVIVAGYTTDGANGEAFLILKYSGAGIPLWTNRYQGPGNGGDFAYGVAFDGNGNVFVTGSSQGDDGDDDYVTIKYSGAGVPLWTNRYDGLGNSYDRANAVAVDGSGNVFVTGLSGSGGNSEFVTIKYSGAGTPLWTNRLDALGNTQAWPALAVDSGGRAVVTGASGPFDNSDFVTVAYSSAGLALWTNRYAGPWNTGDRANAVAMDGSGNVFVTGTAYVGNGYHYATIKYSGTGVPLWTNYYNGLGSFEDQAKAVAVDRNGSNVVVTGFSDVGGGNSDFATVAYSSAGVPLWTNRYDGPGNGSDIALAVTVDGGGNTFVTGYSQATNGDYVYATVAYSSAGVPLWTNLYSGPGNGIDLASDVAVDIVGDVFVVGRSGGDSSFSDCTTIKYSAAGISLWTNRYNGLRDGVDVASAIAVDGNDNVVVAGSSQGSGSSSDFATIKYSSAGLPLWTNRYNGPGNDNDFASAVAVDGSGNVFVTGFSAGLTGDYATIKYSGAGVPLWTNRYDGPGNGNDQATAMAVDGSGNVVVTGYSQGTNGFYDYATIKYSGAGVPLWTNCYDGPGNGNDQATAIAVDGSGNVVVTGYSQGANGDDDYATIKYSTAGMSLWTNCYDGPGNGNDQATAIAVDGSGNVFVAGWPATIKYSAAGVLLWSRSDGGSALGVDSVGNLVVTGIGGHVTIKYSDVGLPVWTNRFDAANSGEGVRAVIAIDHSGNVVVAGTSYSNPLSGSYPFDYQTVAYSSAGLPLWTNRYNGPKNGGDYVRAVAVDSTGSVFVTGFSDGDGGSSDFATIKYAVAGLQPIQLNHQIIGNHLVLSWTNAAFSLQSAPAAQAAYIYISGATSPHTNAITGDQQYFRLKAN